MGDLEIPIRELHARTGHYVRGTMTRGRIVVTDRGVPVAELRPLAGEARTKKEATWKERALLPSYSAIMDEPVGGADSSLAVAEDRERAM